MTVRNVLIPTYFASHTVVPYRYRWGMLHAGLFQCCIFMICWSHLKCMLSNPGTLPRIWPSQLLEKVKELSEIRKLQDKEYKESGTTKGLSVYHGVASAITINRYTHTMRYLWNCVENMDHHCPWMNNCVGKENHKFFMLFLLYVGLGSGYSIVMTGLRLYTCYASKKIGDMET